MEVFPLHGFGAIEQGRHDFFRVGADAAPEPVASARFIHVWQRTPDGWKLKREFSYDHDGE